MIIRLKKALPGLFVLGYLALLIFTSQPANAAKELNASEIAKLEERVSKGYSNKFCNAVGMGVSQDGALKLSIVENSNPSFNPSLWIDLARSGKEKFKVLSDERIADLSSKQIIERCGVAIGIYAQSDIDIFKEYFKKELLEIE